jgi:NAD(P)H-flavin reductase
MASAKHGYREVAQIFADAAPTGNTRAWDALIGNLNAALDTRVHSVERLTPTIVEVVVHAPVHARKFLPGQFFRFQNFESQSQMVDGTSLTMEGLALTGAWVDAERGLLSMIALEMGVSSRLCATLKPGDPIVVMGPTGAPTEIPRGETVVLCGGGLGNAVLFSVAKAMRAAGNRVIYFAGYRKSDDIFKREEVEDSSDQVIWSNDLGAPIQPNRPQDRSFQGNIVQSMIAYAEGRLGETVAPLSEVNRIIAIGSDRMMAAVTGARKTVLAKHLRTDHIAIASINSPMQCMLKEVCAQCLQRHIDPVTGEESFVFSCFNQDQEQDRMDWGNLAARLRQNTVLEKLSTRWFEHLVQV